ncbi:MAG: IS5/IS1182 family transposase [Nanoarchaeota archaeon]
MAKTNRKRWGKKKKYKRDWQKYNEELIRRGTFYLDFEWAKGWKRELREMNKGKVGAPYQFPKSLIDLQAIWLEFTDLRGVIGITRQVVDIGKIPYYNCFSTVNRRINMMSLKFKLPKDKDIYCATDMTGVKMNMSGEYFEKMYGDGKKKFIKVTLTGNPYTKDLYEVDVAIEGEELSEPDIAMTHMTELDAGGYNILGFWGDGKYDVHELFDFLDHYNIPSAIKIRDDAVIDPGGGSFRRSIEVARFKYLGYDKWAERTSYGMRWTGTEGIISAVKRKFGERVRAKKEENMLREAKRKFWAYEKIRNYARA